MTYEIVKYRPEHRKQLLELQTHLWGTDLALNAAYLKWKYERNPYIDAPYIHVVLHEGRVVATRGGYVTRWQVGDPPQRLNWMAGADTVIAPEHRGGGLYEKMTRAVLDDMAADGYTHTLTLTSAPIAFWGTTKMGWRCPGAYRVLRRETGRGRLARIRGGLARRWPALGGLWQDRRDASWDVSMGPFAALDGADGRRGDSALDSICVEQTPRPEAMAALVERVGSDGRIRHVRDKAFFSWRFEDPFRAFRFLYWDDGELQGYLILSTRHPALRPTEIAIVDWEAANTQIKNELLRTAIDWGGFDSLTIWSATLPEETRALLRDAGFEHVRPRLRDRTGRLEPNWPGFLIRPTMIDVDDDNWTVGGRDLLNISNWEMRQVYAG
jgi:hypothetical protein